jgi:rare lipoprotein A
MAAVARRDMKKQGFRGSRSARHAGLAPALALATGLAATLLLLTGCMGGGRVQKGQASWYGDKFHGRRTASGEVFNQNALTAAHPSWAFGSRVKVTELGMGRTIIVRINDRSPGHDGRVIDLSKGAFARLAPLDRGLIDVRIDRLD